MVPAGGAEVVNCGKRGSADRAAGRKVVQFRLVAVGAGETATA
jgi:hypothetical protein